MTTILVKDDLRASVEAATGGQVTVLYTAAGHPSYMVRLPKFNLQDIDQSLGTGVHPAFIVNGIEKSEIWIGQHLGLQKDGNLLSLPGVTPTVYGTFDVNRGWAAANGPGWHLMTVAEWSAIALWCWKNGTLPRGNNAYGRDIGSPWETATRSDGYAPGDTAGAAMTLTGSGPASWRHNGQPSGIADLNGNLWEWNGGLRLQDGEIQILPNNDAADNTKDQSANSPLWKAIKATDGSLVAPGTSGTLKYDATNASGTGALILSDTLANQVADESPDYAAVTLEGMTAKVGLTVPAIAKALGVYPVGSGLSGDYIWARNRGECLPLAGGHWSRGAGGGVFARILHNARADVNGSVGARPAYVL
jgi:hypothetical protein